MVLGSLGWGEQTFPPVALVWLKEGQARPDLLALLDLVLLDREAQTLMSFRPSLSLC